MDPPVARGDLYVETTHIREQMRKRTQQATTRLVGAVAPAINEASFASTPDFVPVPPGSPVVPGLERGVSDIANADASRLIRVSSINMYLHRRSNNLAASNEGPGLEPRPCECKSCPFSTGPLLSQRFTLLQRVYELNCSLYGEGTADDLLKFI